MTVQTLFRALGRAWYLVVVGLAGTALLCLNVSQARGIYWSHVEVFFVGPPAGYEPNAFIAAPESIIATAGLIQREVSGEQVARVASDEVTLPQQGVRQGQLVRLPNAGGQWANNFNRPVLAVEAVDETAIGASGRLNETIATITERLAERQREVQVPPQDWITLRLVPSTPRSEYVQGDKRRALAASVLLGGLLTTGAVVARESVRSRRLADPSVAEEGSNLSGATPPGFS